MRIFITFFIHSITISFIFLFTSCEDELENLMAETLNTNEERSSLTQSNSKLEEIIFVTEEMPRFPGCEDLSTVSEKQACSTKKMLEFIYANFKYPKEVDIQGTLVVAVMVEKDGSLSDFKIMRDIGGGASEEALRVLKMMPNFVPGRQSGYLVRTQLNIPLKICLE